MTDVLAVTEAFGQPDKLVAEFTHGAERQHEIAAEIGTVKAATMCSTMLLCSSARLFAASVSPRGSASIFPLLCDALDDRLG